MEKAQKEVASVFTVTSFKTGKSVEEVVFGSGQEPIKYLRTQYPRHTKFVLEGFEFDDKFVPLYIKTRRND